MTNAIERKPEKADCQGPLNTGLSGAFVGRIKNGFLGRMSKFKAPTIVVNLALMARADESGRCFPSVNTIQEDTGLARATVIKALARLEAAGEIVISHGKGVGSRYIIATSSPIEPVQEMNRTSSPDEPDQFTGYTGPVHAVNSNQIQEPDKLTRLNNQTHISSARADSIPSGLLELIDGWNSLGEQIVKPGNGARRQPPAKAVLSGWKRATKNPEQREYLTDIPAVLKRIETAKFLHGRGFFSLSWLFGKNNKQELVLPHLMNGDYSGANGNGKRDTKPGPGQQHPADATSGF